MKLYKAKRLRGDKLLCLKCYKYKLPFFFRKRYNGYLKKTSYCAECMKKYNKEYRKTHPLSLKGRKQAKSYRQTHKRKMRKYERKRILARYGLTEKEYKKLLKKQKYSCAICGKKRADKKRKALHIDHDHKTNIVRGLLCAACNTALGRFYNIKTLKKAVKYLQKAR